MIARNWLETLWRTSYKGAAFFVETDTEGGGRRIVIHEFPMRDTPYLEDLGERYREFSLTAYVASDRADSDAAALMSVCATRGPGIVVLPGQGPVLVRCLEFNRKHEKDKLGYIAHELRFVREGFGSALASVTSLINMVFIQAEAVATIAAAAFAATALFKDQPDYVSETLVSGTENALATFEAARTSVNVEPVANAKQRDVIQEAFTALPVAMAEEDAVAIEGIGLTVMNVAMALAENMDANTAISIMGDIVTVTPLVEAPDPLTTSIHRHSVATNKNVSNTLLRIAALTAYCEAIVKVKLSDRPFAITLRANVSGFFDEQLGALPSESYEVYYSLIKLRDATIDYLSRAILDLAPVVKVTASLGMPSLFWAWRLYADPTRSGELVARNRIEHPSFMPPTFEALGK